ncbi:MAG: penicillin-binding protein activator [Xanthomonadales bacterium]|jgi:outer membrane PBP1 activator LpoA protein|nr:penicillin-binding protein activator [Xanthomonadales bacterium]
MNTARPKSLRATRKCFAHGCVIALVLWLGACATPPPAPPPESVAVLEARNAANRGDWSDAARAWEQAAMDEAGPDNAWAEAANAWVLAGDLERAEATLDRLPTGGLTQRSDRALVALVRGELALAENDLAGAERYLGDAGDGLRGTERSRLQAARDRLRILRDDPAAGVLADVNAILERGQPDSAAAIDVLQRLESVDRTRLALEAEQPTPLGQWCALALDLRQTLLGRRDLLEAASEWQTLQPLHPVNEQQYLELAWQYGQRFTPPGRVAVLLPASGSLAAAGSAIRDGLISAWLDHPARTELVFLPVGEEPDSALAAYQEAERAGFPWVIGPLRRESVNLVANQPGASVPGLLLNWPDIENQSPAPGFELASPEPTGPVGSLESDFYSLSLSQEAEARAVAQQMLARGHRQAILLLADSAWGERTEAAFMDAYLSGGGEVISLERFSAGDADHSGKLTRLLQIQDGRDRRRRLQSLLNLPLEFEDSRRDDFAAFFLAADPVLGRQLKPQLRFFDAGSKPVFAMSRVYSGAPDPSRDGDLNGVVIPTTRWSLEPTAVDDTATLESLRNGAFASLYALGRDAWDILPWLDLMRRNPGFAYPGAVGDLQLGADGRLTREPAWAVFRRGRPVPLEDLVRPATPADTRLP